MAILRKKKGQKAGGRIKNSLLNVGIGAGMSVVDAMVTNDAVGYVALGAGVLLPIAVGGTERAGDALAAVGAYKVATQMNLAGTLGLGSNPATAGVFDSRNAIGRTLFNQKKKAERKSGKHNPNNTIG